MHAGRVQAGIQDDKPDTGWADNYVRDFISNVRQGSVISKLQEDGI